MMPWDGEADAGPLQVRGTVLTVRRVDAYHAMTVVAPGIAARFRPGQFVAVAVGGPESAMLLRRAFSIHDVRPDHGGTVEFVFAANGPGTRWLAARPAVPGSARPGQLPAGRRRLRQRAAVRARWQAPRSRLHGRFPAWCGQRGPRLRGADRAADRPDSHYHHRGRVAGLTRRRHRHARPDDPRRADGRD